MDRRPKPRGDRRWFDHLFAELSVELGRLAPRYPLWIRIGELGVDPARLRGEDVVSFCDLHLAGFLADHGLTLSTRRRRKLARNLSRFDPYRQTPSDHMARIASLGS